MSLICSQTFWNPSQIISRSRRGGGSRLVQQHSLYTALTSPHDFNVCFS